GLVLAHTLPLVSQQFNNPTCIGSEDRRETIFVEADLARGIPIHGDRTCAYCFDGDLPKLALVKDHHISSSLRSRWHMARYFGSGPPALPGDYSSDDGDGNHQNDEKPMAAASRPHGC